MVLAPGSLACGCFPLLGQLWRKLIHVTQECGHLPYLLFVQRTLPSRHSAETYSVLNDVEILVLRHVGCVLHELRRTRIECVPKRSMALMGITMTAGAVGLVNLHSGQQVGICCRDRVSGFSSVSIQR